MPQQPAKARDRVAHTHSVQRLPRPCLGVGDDRFAAFLLDPFDDRDRAPTVVLHVDAVNIGIFAQVRES